MIQCFGRKQINAENEPADRSPFYKKIFMFPENNSSIMVFSFMSDTNTFTLMVIYDDFPWNGLQLVPAELFELEPPTSISSLQKKNEFLNPFLQTITELRFVSTFYSNLILFEFMLK